MNLAIAIDYTASNGDPEEQDCLHFVGPNNQYEAAINMVGTILEPYDYDKLFPVFGFGGIDQFNGSTRINHCFPLNDLTNHPSVQGISGVIDVYRRTLAGIKFSGPTYFGPILDSFFEHCARQHQQGQKNYNLLLILTDGTIHDMAKTKKRIVDLAQLPASVIIVGLGDADFDDMVELDGDQQRVTDEEGRVACRDIVQFVEFDQAVKMGNLGELVLEEIPNQFVGWMKANSVPVVYSPQEMHMQWQ